MDLFYLNEKLSEATSALMLPHPKGEPTSIASAFNSLHLGLLGVDLDALDDDNARLWIGIIRDFMNTSGLQDPDSRGLWLVKAETLSVEEKRDFSMAVRELSAWARRATDDVFMS